MYMPKNNDSKFSHKKSQLNQDLFVLDELGLKTNGFFVEFGATNGIDISNTYLLEKHFGWSGILAEPSKHWHEQLTKNRTADISTECVWKSSGENIMFNEVDASSRSYGPELSTIDAYSSCDNHSTIRENGKRYLVPTISLEDLLARFHAPAEIDYLSIDTEGSEFEILNNFDFNKYDIKIITCEHNFTPMREQIFNLLTSHGFQRKYDSLSRWDDWYVKQ